MERAMRRFASSSFEMGQAGVWFSDDIEEVCLAEKSSPSRTSSQSSCTRGFGRSQSAPMVICKQLDGYGRLLRTSTSVDGYEDEAAALSAANTPLEEWLLLKHAAAPKDDVSCENASTNPVNEVGKRLNQLNLSTSVDCHHFRVDDVIADRNCFMDVTDRNVRLDPSDLQIHEREMLYSLCDEWAARHLADDMDANPHILVSNQKCFRRSHRASLKPMSTFDEDDVGGFALLYTPEADAELESTRAQYNREIGLLLSRADGAI